MPDTSQLHKYRTAIYRGMALLVFLFFFSRGASAQGQVSPKELVASGGKIAVSHSGNDRVGKVLAYQLRERIKSSAQMELIGGGAANAFIRVSIVTLNPFESSGSQVAATAYSCTWTYEISAYGHTIELLITSQAGTAGESDVEEVASGLVATTDKQRRVGPSQFAKALEIMKGLGNESK